MTATFLSSLIVVGGVGQLALVAVSPAIPWVLHWRDELAAVSPLTRRLFWVYASYILATNLAFGLLSALAPASLLDGSTLAAAVTGFMSLYWGARLGIQFSGFHAVAPAGRLFRAAEAALVLLFVSLTGVYATAAVVNLM